MNSTQIKYLQDLLRFAYREAQEIMLIAEEDRSDHQTRLAQIVENLAQSNLSNETLENLDQKVEVYTEVGYLDRFSKQDIFQNVLYIHQHSLIELNEQKYMVTRIQLGADHSIELEVASENVPTYSIDSPSVSVINHNRKHTKHEQSFVSLESMAEGFLTYAEQATLPVMLGKDEFHQPIYFDLATLPHLLVGGKAESGKSVFVDSVVASITMVRSLEEVQFIMIDPKVIELSVYNGSPYLISPVITNMEEVPNVLDSLIQDIDQKYELLQNEGVRSITEYNHKQKAQNGQLMLSTVVIVNQLESVAENLFADVILSILQKGRKVGIHLILCTSNIDADRLPGTIKAAIPGRICFAVQSPLQYQILMGTTSVSYPNLLGKGDGMVRFNNREPFRFQCMAICDPQQTMQYIERVKEKHGLHNNREYR